MEMRELHWLMNMLTHMDVGIVVFDSKGKVNLWNNFMENHSGMSSTDIQEQHSLFELYPVFQEAWLQNKLQSAVILDHEVFISWEQMPHLFNFSASRPITSSASKMYQNITINALKDASGNPSLISMMVHDVTDIAINKIALQDANIQLEKISRTDKLTGLVNRGYWQERLVNALGLHKRYQTPTSLIMFDIDHFKRVNDSYGHLAGDLVIQQVASVAQQSLRTCDIVGRYGGEEFGIILPETSLDGALVFAERLRKAVENLTIKYEQQAINITISLGVAEADKSMVTENQWLEAADQALYSAKNKGRNFVCST